jgi:hypothetical protein
MFRVSFIETKPWMKKSVRSYPRKPLKHEPLLEPLHEPLHEQPHERPHEPDWPVYAPGLTEDAP